MSNPPRSAPSIRTRLLQLVVACVVPASLMAAALGVHDYLQAREQLIESTRGTVRALTVALDVELAQPRSALAALAGAGLLGPAPEAELHARMRQAEPTLGLAGLFLVGADGSLRLHTARSPGSALPPLPAEVLAAAAGRAPTLTGLMTDPVSGQRGMAVVVPLTAGRAGLAIGGWLPPQRLQQLLVREQLPERWITAVYDPAGRVLARSHELAAFFGQPGPASLREAMARSTGGTLQSVSLEGIEVVTVFSKAGDTGWGVSLGVPREELEAPLRRRAMLWLLAALALLGLTLGLAWRLGGTIVRSIEAMRGPATALGAGEPVVVPEVSFREAQALGGVLAEASARQQAAATALRRSHDALVRSNLDLQQYAFVASHDLRGPLNTVSSYLELVRRKHGAEIPPPAQALLDRAAAAVRQLDQLTQALLGYARLDSQARPFGEVAMGEVLQEVLAAIHGMVQESDAQVTSDPLPVVWGDRTQLAQLLQNLVGNAIKYRAQRRPEVHVAARRGEGEWVFAVRDNGIGIEPRHQERIFEIFKRLHTQEEIPGTGIGLAICRRVVQAHHGRLWVESRAGAGSTFLFTVADKENTA